MGRRPEKRDFHNRANRTVPIRLGLLGTFSLTLGDGRETEVSSKKNRALLAILALALGHQATRERLCGLLWSDRGEEQARGSLRQSLAVLRKELGEADTLVLHTHDDVVALAASGAFNRRGGDYPVVGHKRCGEPPARGSAVARRIAGRYHHQGSGI